jgi:hypothetical protein
MAKASSLASERILSRTVALRAILRSVGISGAEVSLVAADIE